MKKELTKEQLIEYVKKHGKTEVELTEDCGDWKCKGLVANLSYNSNKNYLTDGISHYGNYKGNFIVLNYKEEGFPIDTFKFLEVGQLVDVPEKFDWFTGGKEVEIVQVHKIDATYLLEDKDGNTLWVSALYVKPHTPEPVQEMTVEEVCKELGREIKIKK